MKNRPNNSNSGWTLIAGIVLAAFTVNGYMASQLKITQENLTVNQRALEVAVQQRVDADKRADGLQTQVDGLGKQLDASNLKVKDLQDRLNTAGGEVASCQEQAQVNQDTQKALEERIGILSNSNRVLIDQLFTLQKEKQQLEARQVSPKVQMVLIPATGNAAGSPFCLDMRSTATWLNLANQMLYSETMLYILVTIVLLSGSVTIYVYLKPLFNQKH